MFIHAGQCTGTLSVKRKMYVSYIISFVNMYLYINIRLSKNKCGNFSEVIPVQKVVDWGKNPQD